MKYGASCAPSLSWVWLRESSAAIASSKGSRGSAGAAAKTRSDQRATDIVRILNSSQPMWSIQPQNPLKVGLMRQAHHTLELDSPGRGLHPFTRPVERWLGSIKAQDGLITL